MDEKTKKEIEELERDLKEESKELSPSSEIQKKKIPPFFSQNFLILLGIGMSLILILAGIVFFYQIFIAKERPSENIASKEKRENLEVKPALEEQRANQTLVYSKEKIDFLTSQPNYPYKLEFKNFLVSLDAKNFLKLDVIFYFDRDSDYKEAMHHEIIYRDFIFKFLGSIETKNWKEERYVKELEKRILHEMEKRGLKPLPKAVQLDGFLLRA
ncbi:MAG: hypothetical protein NZ530_02140 [Thermodesulfobacteriaceae bacterium]|nr:hypothetical protein [Thermodesulfobacteriaceae bacterium]MDW8135858.1 hypothetical protein [Thermodesulfobacterium sp.]